MCTRVHIEGHNPFIYFRNQYRHERCVVCQVGAGVEKQSTAKEPDENLWGKFAFYVKAKMVESG
jgi:hypothetical protein